MSTTQGGPSGKPTFRMRQTPPGDDPDMSPVEQLPAEDEVEYVIEDLDAAESPTGGAAVSCNSKCYCFGSN